ncbi:MAG: Ig-like domain-containing protein, partial [Chitinophagaceae bacterium]|nr:Ig-like domain-containing protein [Chitinophagaceae bacterium]
MGPRMMIMAAAGLLWAACSKSGETPAPPAPPAALRLVNATLNNSTGPDYVLINLMPVMRYNFSEKVDRSTANAAITFSDANGGTVPFQINWERSDSTMLVQPQAGALKGLTRYSVVLDNKLKSARGANLQSGFTFQFSTQIDSTSKFPAISDDSLLTLVQKQTLRYFWDFGHPVSGMARERNTSGDVVTSGGSGFGMMSIITGIHRGFITRQQGLLRLQTMVDFLLNKAQRFKGAYPHWMNGITGAVVPFSAKDNGADLVE